MTTTLNPQFQVNLDTAEGATAIHVDSKETLERIEAFKANLDAKKVLMEDEEEEEEEEEEMPAAKGKKLPFWMKKKDSVNFLERHDSEVLRMYLDSAEEPEDVEVPEFTEGDDMDEVLDSLLSVVQHKDSLIQHKDNQLAVAAELLSRQDSGQAYDVEAEVQQRVDSLMTAFFDASAHLPQGFSYEAGMTGGNIYAEAISHIDSDLADEIGVTEAEDSTLQAAFKALTRGGRTDSNSGGRSQNDQINEALNGSRADSTMPKKPPKQFSMVRGA